MNLNPRSINRHLSFPVLVFIVGFACEIHAQSVDADSLAGFWTSAFDTAFCRSHWEESPTLVRTLLAKAEPDEAYNGIGNPFIEDPNSAGGIPKVNQAYVWGLTKSGDNVWFGTLANTVCSTIGTLMRIGGELHAFETPSVVCEYGNCAYDATVPEGNGDWRTPKIFRYDTQAGTLMDMTPDDALIQETYGFRSAGSLGDVVFLAGPGIGDDKKIRMFAFHAQTYEYLGSAEFPEYTNIRQWLVLEGVLYTSVKNAAGGGSVLRWRGDTEDPFQFEVVGNLDNDAAYLAAHEGRIYVTTWPSVTDPVTASFIISGLFMSPPVPEGGLTTAHAGLWQGVWNPYAYDPDLITSYLYGGGALASFDGYLYWGTIHIPFMSTLGHILFYGLSDSLTAFLGSYRPISIFRGRNLDSDDREIELVYGMSHLPVYTPDNLFTPKGGGRWEIVPNRMGAAPLFGPSGFCNFFNNYTWAMSVYDEQLFIGTMDWSYLYSDVLPILTEVLEIAIAEGSLQLPWYNHGADLFRFPRADSRAYAESLDGVGNYTSYGIRTMVSDDALYLGMANPMNLLTDLTDELPEGGWELIRLGNGSSGIKEGAFHPSAYEIYQNFPNPFNHETQIRYALPKAADVKLEIVDIRGRRVCSLASGKKDAGVHSVTWDGMDSRGFLMPSGVYMILMKTEACVKTSKIILIK